MATGERGAPSQASSLGKRRRERYETYICDLTQADSKNSDETETAGPKKRGRQGARVQGGAAATKRTRRSLATRTQQNNNDKSKAAGRGAGMLAPSMAQGIYHRSLLGLSVPGGSVGILAHGEPLWIEGSGWQIAATATQEPIASSSTTPQQVVIPEAAQGDTQDDDDFQPIPKLDDRQRLFLRTMPEEEERGAVRVIACRLCPRTRFGSWTTFKRHCNTVDKHPVLSNDNFCAGCGDYFGRKDSGNRHGSGGNEKCRSTTEAQAQDKKDRVHRLLEAYDRHLLRCLETGEEIGQSFSEAVNQQLDNTSKKISRTAGNWPEGDSWAAGL